MSRRPLARVPAFARLAVLTLALAGLLLPGAPGPAAPARAEHLPQHQPVARVQVVINKVIVHDDNDPESQGDVEIFGWFVKVNDGCPADSAELACLTDLLRFGLDEFGAHSGETKVLDRAIPSAGDTIWDESISTAFGIPLYPGEAYRLAILGMDEDLVFSDFLGRVERIMTEQDNWGIGTHLERATLNKDVGNVYGSGGPADISVEYQIRRLPLPDLRPVNIKVAEGAGSAEDEVCMGVQNAGAMDAPRFQLALYLDGTSPPIRTRELSGLSSGGYAEACLLAPLPPTGEHSLMVIVDEPRGIFEENETNNWYAQPYAAARIAPGDGPGGPGIAPTVADPGANPGAGRNPSPPGPQPGAIQADLVAWGIHIRSVEPGGSADCDPGRNDVTVIVKNDGTSAASGFAVRVVVDGEDDEAKERAVSGLEAGKETEVTFEGVRLRRGLRDIAATVDAKKAIAESDEDNNEVKISVNCRAG